jgi:gliding motility-associated-like protein
MKLPFTRLGYLLSCLVGASCQLASAQTVYTPAAVTGYTADVIANGVGPVSGSTTTTVDRGTPTVRWCFANTTFVNPSGQSPTTALPASGLITSATTAGLTFQMAAATGNNSLRIDGAGSGTLTLTTPQPCSEVMVLATEGNGSTAGKTFVVAFTDNTSQTFTNVAVPDWFNGTNPAIVVGSRVNYSDNSVDNQTTNPRIYEVRLVLSNANYGKLVQSVTASKTSTDPVLNVMGISLGANCLGVPVGGTATAAPASICPGSMVALGVTGATIAGGITYQWQASTNGGTTFTNIAGATSASYVAMPTATTQYRVVLTCSQQSGTSTPITVTVNAATAAVAYTAAGTTPTFCRTGTQAVVTATPAGGTFSAGAGLSINTTTGTLNLGASTVGTYTVTYTLPAGSCASAATTTVTVVAPVTPTLAYSAASYCQSVGSTTPTTVSPAGGTFSGSSGLVINATTGVINLTQTPAGTYTVSYTSPGACSATATATLAISTATPATLTYGGTNFCKAGAAPVPTVTPAGGAFSGSSGLSINTTTGAIDLNATPNGTYTVTYASAVQCTSPATVTLVIKGNPAPVYPTVLTPNGDGKNDVLALKIADVQNYSLEVFNRWGRRVFETKNAAEGWNPGTSNSAGTYYYLVEYTDCAGRALRERTWIEVVK